MKLILLLLSISLAALADSVSVKDIVQSNFLEPVDIVKSKIILSKNELKQIKKLSKQPLKSRIYRYYKISSKGKILGYAILIVKKVRSKKATLLYFVEPDSTLKFIEILSFLEPPEFIPQESWLDQFKHKSSSDSFRVGDDVPTISGATLSAYVITKSARVAIALFEMKIR